MASSIQVKRGTTAKVSAYTPLSGELVLDTTTNKLYAGDGTTAGGKQVLGSRKGVTDGSGAAAGDIGEYLSASASSVALTTATAVNVTSLTLTAGDWDIHGTVEYTASGNIITNIIGGFTTTSATLPAFPNRYRNPSAAAVDTTAVAVPYQRLLITTSTVLYLVVQASFASGAVSASGVIRARRSN
ncbi:hypothetical protein N5580_13035 [Pantoea piersonii]|uniref:Major tropism determinant N-terminal domain-containing protein n=1 Tax=Pantoea piersonii TaxID=2364647 RepID=A0AAJ5QG15_9GAMM|nr:hypothetical protein [Pantoea piersonii]WBG90012.1 hypothetical protein N5580_13035 [Pantoea piersonii]